MIAEIRTRDNESDERGAWPLAWNGASIISYDMHSSTPDGTNIMITPSVRNSPYIPKPNTQADPLPPNSSVNANNDDKLRECPDQAQADLELMPCNTPPNATFIVAGPRSLHNGGVNAANVDGSVIWLANDIDQYLMARMVSINDGQIMTTGYSNQ
jgi:hypothetical protein